MSSGRPERGEYADYAQSDIDYVAGDDAVAALTSQGEQVVALLSSMGAVDGLTYAPGKWTLKEVVGHLIDDERIFAYRALCVARADKRPLPGFEEKEYVAATNFEARGLQSLIEEYRSVRAASITFFDGLTEEEWKRTGIVNDYETSVRGLAFHVAGHELHHLRTLTSKYLRR
ncbi:MAG TPA: DinB family protein [Thermoanaerobaculia bacterium]|jgi:hypothetical protein|nr:DinB family protein [Thermoanaerobaculia bacterium]